MLKSMRRKTITRNIIIGIIVALLASYVLVSFGQAPPKVQGDVIARLGDSTIKFRDALIQKENLRSRFTSLDAERINQFAASTLISDAIFLHGAKDAGMHVSDEELKDYVVHLRKMLGGEDHYLTNEQWRDFIQYRYRLQVENFEEYLRDKEILVQRFRTILGDSAFLPEAELKQAYIQENTKLDMELVLLNPYMVREQVALDDAALRAYYDANPQLFMSGDQRQIRFVTVEKKAFQDAITPSEEDISTYYEDNKERAFKDPEKVKISHILLAMADRTEEEATDTLNDIRQEIEDGLDFAEAAKKYSEHGPTKESGGQLPLSPRGQLARQFGPEFEKAAFDTQVGSMSQPVKSRLGMHLIRVEERTPEGIRSLDDCRDEIVKILKREKGTVQARTRASDFLAQLELGRGFEEAASEMELTVSVSPFFDAHNQSNLGDVLGMNGRVRQKVFELEKVEDFTEVIDAGAMFVVAQWAAEKEPEPLPFDENLMRIRLSAQSLRGKELILKTLDEIKAKLAADASMDLRTACGSYDFIADNAVMQTGLFGADDVPVQLRVPEIDVEEDLFPLEQGAFLGPMEVRNETQFVLGRVVQKESADMELYAKERMNIISSLRGEAQYELLSLYADAMRETLDPNQQIAARVQATLAKF